MVLLYAEDSCPPPAPCPRPYAQLQSHGRPAEKSSTQHGLAGLELSTSPALPRSTACSSPSKVQRPLTICWSAKNWLWKMSKRGQEYPDPAISESYIMSDDFWMLRYSASSIVPELYAWTPRTQDGLSKLLLTSTDCIPQMPWKKQDLYASCQKKSGLTKPSSSCQVGSRARQWTTPGAIPYEFWI